MSKLGDFFKQRKAHRLMRTAIRLQTDVVTYGSKRPEWINAFDLNLAEHCITKANEIWPTIGKTISAK